MISRSVKTTELPPRTTLPKRTASKLNDLNGIAIES